MPAYVNSPSLLRLLLGEEQAMMNGRSKFVAITKAGGIDFTVTVVTKSCIL